MMENGEHIMVFPGGSREVCKHKGEAYKLVWRNHLGFAHMAIEFGYDIIPVASIGGEETYEILWDAVRLQFPALETAVTSLLEKFGP